ncbi:TIGR03560 family F420-dependent LLM class oxidoreductase [Saccharopolyspora sp. K220]|uniref:TIGR03560 family F420-dependent LLM class oxidoreductase n=1 Tax=Saccharopolyspora soli TaxID=2926618 RepID=UPI001F59BEC3|nr:TIGR03560 family F420-dependent LLM class oxidoreductase [Saccharopolyspora soli]MCI2416685.1 TIGR03560 family F420-dependent LLM class oxidoreductase [Saccharopolyspora soli]
MRLGLQLTSFNYPKTPPAKLFERIAATARTAEEAGFELFAVMDHLMQLPLQGAPNEPMLEPYTLLGAVAASTERIRLGTLVTGVTYHNPARLAKTVTALDVVSGGRALLGIGAAWFEEEHRRYGYTFPSVQQRFEWLEEALQICRSMFAGEPTTFRGEHYAVTDAFNEPQPVHVPPILIGGAGERRTIPLAAKYADILNLNCGFPDIPRKLAVLREKCAAVGRDYAAINKNALAVVFLGRTTEEAMAKRDALLARQRLGVASGRGLPAALTSRMIVGDADSVGEQIQGLIELGLDGVIVNLPGDSHEPDRLAHAGGILRAALGGAVRAGGR